MFMFAVLLSAVAIQMLGEPVPVQISGKLHRVAVVRETVLAEQPCGEAAPAVVRRAVQTVWLEIGIVETASERLRLFKILEPDGKVFARGRRGLTPLALDRVGVGRTAVLKGKRMPASAPRQMTPTVWEQLVVDVE